MTHAAAQAVERIVYTLHDSGIVFIPKNTLLEANLSKIWCDKVLRFLMERLEAAGFGPDETSIMNDHSFVVVIVNSRFRTAHQWRWQSTTKRRILPMVEMAKRLAIIANPPKRTSTDRIRR